MNSAVPSTARQTLATANDAVRSDVRVGSEPAAGRRFALIVLLLSVVFLTAPIVLAPNTAQEDALITLRHARNLAEGRGLVYNVGERVLGSTAPLWAIVIAPLFWLPFPESVIVQLIQTASCGGLIAGVWIMGAVAKREAYYARAALLAGTALHYRLSHVGHAGMETGAQVLLAALLVRCMILSERTACTRLGQALLGILLVALRLDSVFVLAGLYGARFLMSLSEGSLRRHAVLDVGVPGVLVGAYVLFECGVLYLYYGSPVPQSMLAKAGAGRVWQQSEAGMFIDSIRGVWSLDYPWPRVLRSLQPAWLWPLWWCAAAFFVWRSSARDAGARFLLGGAVLYGGLYAAFFTVGRAGIFSWYSHLPTFLLLSAVLMGLIVRRRSFAARALLGGFCVAVLFMGAMTVRGISMGGSENTELRAIGEFLRQRGATSVMLEPIGYIGFYSRAKVYDLAGLVSPDVLALRKRGQAGWFAESVKQFKPEFIVLRSGEVEMNLGWNVGVLFEDAAQGREFLETYEKLGVRGLQPSAHRMAVYSRKGRAVIEQIVKHDRLGSERDVRVRVPSTGSRARALVAEPDDVASLRVRQ